MRQRIKNACGNRDPDGIVTECPEQIPADRGDRQAAETDGRHDVERIVLHEDDVCGIDSDVRSASHADADVGGGKRRCIIDAVACHRRDFSRFPDPADDFRFFVRKDAGDDILPGNACLSGDGFCCLRIVARQHICFNAHRRQF